MVEQTAIQSRKQILLIEDKMSRVGTVVKERFPKMYSKDLIEILFKLPYTKRAFLVGDGFGNVKTVRGYLNHLEQTGLFRSETIGKEKLYLNVELMKVLKL